MLSNSKSDLLELPGVEKWISSLGSRQLWYVDFEGYNRDGEYSPSELVAIVQMIKDRYGEPSAFRWSTGNEVKPIEARDSNELVELIANHRALDFSFQFDAESLLPVIEASRFGDDHWRCMLNFHVLSGLDLQYMVDLSGDGPDRAAQLTNARSEGVSAFSAIGLDVFYSVLPVFFGRHRPRIAGRDHLFRRLPWLFAARAGDEELATLEGLPLETSVAGEYTVVQTGEIPVAPLAQRSAMTTLLEPLLRPLDGSVEVVADVGQRLFLGEQDGGVELSAT